MPLAAGVTQIVSHETQIIVTIFHHGQDWHPDDKGVCLGPANLLIVDRWSDPSSWHQCRSSELSADRPNVL